MHTLGLSAKLEPGRIQLEFSWPLNPWEWCKNTFIQWHQNLHDRRRLSCLNEHLLRDIGLAEEANEKERKKLYSAHEIRHPML